MNKTGKRKKGAKGFSMVELLAAMTILLVLMLLMTSLMDQVQKSWRFGEERISQFREARVSFDLMTKNMSQASMNTYWDFNYDSSNQVEGYEKRSELHFYVDHGSLIDTKLGLAGKTNGHAVFFQAPLGFSVRYRNLGNLFNGRGYLVVHGDDRKFRPSFVTAERSRFRLMEFRPPAEANQVFEDSIDEIVEGNGEQEFKDWWNQGLNIGTENLSFVDYLNPLAENIILLVASPMDSLDSQSKNRFDDAMEIAPNYRFDSNEPTLAGSGQQVPPLVRVTMIAIDESSATRLADKFGDAKPDLIPQNLFTQASKYSDDLNTLIEKFNRDNREGTDIRVNYRVFSTTVMLRSAKWVL